MILRYRQYMDSLSLLDILALLDCKDFLYQGGQDVQEGLVYGAE